MPLLELTILGSGPAWANPNGANSGYLLRYGSDRLLMECGSGIIGRLRGTTPIGDLGGVIVSHMHADHFIDLIQLRYGVKYGGWRTRPLPVYLPPGGVGFLAGLGEALDGAADFFSSTFELHEYHERAPLVIGELRLTFRRVRHYVPSYAIRIEADRSLVFSGDAAPCDALADHARGANVFLCEAAISSLAQDDPHPERRGHMTAGEAGALATAAGVSSLLLTHYRSNGQGEVCLVKEARQRFSGRVLLAREGETYRV
ncbi:MAG: MBL fold metallo-hydrolase [Chloroflexi bacterium]|nr:MBL fold metallo-hydrolase [Chloroflexota bacterium]